MQEQARHRRENHEHTRGRRGKLLAEKANFSPGEQTFTSCNGESPNLDVVEGNGFVVKEDV